MAKIILYDTPNKGELKISPSIISNGKVIQATIFITGVGYVEFNLKEMEKLHSALGKLLIYGKDSR